MSWKTLIIASIFASIAFGMGAYIRMNQINFNYGSSTPDVNGTGSMVNEEKPEPEITIKGRINFLVIGEDSVESSRRSDTVLFVAADIDQRNVRVLSLPRDTRMRIPKHGYQKLNHAFAYGHEDLLRQTVQDFLGTPIHYYITLDYDNFPKVVDMIGGVDIYVGKAMKYRDRSQGLYIDIPVGKQHMDGETALKYVRFRHDAQGDIGRVRRQQQFLKAVLHKMYEPANMLRFPSLSKEMSETLRTDMPPSLTFQMCLFIKQLDKETDKIFFKMLPGRPETIDRLSYWIADPRDTIPYLNASTAELISMDKEARSAAAANSRTQDPSAVTTAGNYSPDSEYGIRADDEQAAGALSGSAPAPEDIMSIVTSIPEAVAVLNGTGRSGMSKSVAAHLQRMGVDVVYTGNAKHFDYRSTNVIYPEQAGESTIKTAQLLARLCGVSPTLTRKNTLAVYPSLIVGHDYEKLIQRLENSYTVER